MPEQGGNEGHLSVVNPIWASLGAIWALGAAVPEIPLIEVLLLQNGIPGAALEGVSPMRIPWLHGEVMVMYPGGAGSSPPSG